MLGLYHKVFTGGRNIMKNSYMKTFIVACAATFLFIGSQAHTAEAVTKYRVVKGDSLWKLANQNGISIDDIKQENNRIHNVIYTGEILQIPDQLKKDDKGPERKDTKKAKVSISSKEKNLLARLVEAEAKGEPYEGKVAVATVVLNRVDSSLFPDTITDVIHQKRAFTPVQNGEIKKPASDEAKEAVEEALTRDDRLQDSIFFYNPDIATDKWIRTRDVVLTIDNHVFAK